VVKSGRKWVAVEPSSKIDRFQICGESGHFGHSRPHICVRSRQNRVASSGEHEAAGNCPAKVDEKGRLKIPAVFLEALKEYGNQFYITSTTGESARIYPMRVWSVIEDKLAAYRARTGRRESS